MTRQCRQGGRCRRSRQDAGTRKPHGASLISLMVGIVISMLIMLAMMTLYRDTIHTAVSAGQDATSDGERASGLLAAQIQLQAAGFGLTTPTLGTDLVVLSNASLDSSTQRLSGTVAAVGIAGNAIVWGADTGSGYQCSALYAPASGGLQRLLTTPCVGVAQWPAATWHTSSLMADTRGVAIMAEQTTAAGCQPFGLAVTGGVIVTLVTVRSAVPTGNAGVPIEATVCLANFAAPSA